MKYKIVKLCFSTAVHFGDGGLMTCRNTLCADTLFSALCIESVRKSKETMTSIVKAVQDRQLLISDAFPYIGDVFYLPKPLCEIEHNTAITVDSDSSFKKTIKKLKYIDSSRLDDYLNGRLSKNDIIQMQLVVDNNFGSFDLIHKNSILEEETEPFSVMVFRYKDGAGIWFLLGYEDDSLVDLVEDMFGSLGLTGIGGEVSSGYGKYTITTEELPAHIKMMLGREQGRYMLITTSLPSDSEMECLNQASFLLLKRGGFIASSDYADNLQKKKSIYFISSGAVFKEKWVGQLMNMASTEGRHSVYKYSLPLFIGV